MDNKQRLEMANIMHAAVSKISIAIFNFRNRDIQLVELRKIVKTELKQGLLCPTKEKGDL